MKVSPAIWLKKGMRPSSQWLQDLLIPPICIHCQAKRWAKTPLCLTCLKSLNPFHLKEKRAFVKENSTAENNLGLTTTEGFPFTAANFLFPMSPCLSTLVHGFKYRHFRRHIPFLCSYLRFRPDLMQFFSKCDGLVPVPIHPARRRERGYNQSEIIAQTLSKLSGCPVLDKALIRLRYTESQTKLDRAGRAQNLQEAFACSTPGKVAQKHLVLIDDVFTTGATAAQCSSLLIQSGAIRVDVFALARVNTNLLQNDFSQEMASLSGFML
jgi:ComF family protein